MVAMSGCDEWLQDLTSWFVKKGHNQQKDVVLFLSVGHCCKNLNVTCFVFLI